MFYSVYLVIIKPCSAFSPSLAETQPIVCCVRYLASHYFHRCRYISSLRGELVPYLVRKQFSEIPSSSEDLEHSDPNVKRKDCNSSLGTSLCFVLFCPIRKLHGSDRTECIIEILLYYFFICLPINTHKGPNGLI